MLTAALPCSLPNDRFRVLGWTVGSLLLLLAWDASGLDLAMARWFGTASGFPMESHWLWRGLLHDDMHWPPWLLELALLAAVFRPFGTLKQLALARRLQLALGTLVALLVISILKMHSHTSCPWDLREFGGVATHVSHWAWGVRDGGSGSCFPAGHASAGFAFLGGFFVFRQVLPRTAMRWLAGALVVGFIFGLAQQVRGAHYMSHTLWTAWLCWSTAAVLDAVVSGWTRFVQSRRNRLRAPAPAPAL